MIFSPQPLYLADCFFCFYDWKEPKPFWMLFYLVYGVWDPVRKAVLNF